MIDVCDNMIRYSDAMRVLCDIQAKTYNMNLYDALESVKKELCRKRRLVVRCEHCNIESPLRDLIVYMRKDDLTVFNKAFSGKYDYYGIDGEKVGYIEIGKNGDISVDECYETMGGRESICVFRLNHMDYRIMTSVHELRTPVTIVWDVVEYNKVVLVIKELYEDD